MSKEDEKVEEMEEKIVKAELFDLQEKTREKQQEKAELVDKIDDELMEQLNTIEKEMQELSNNIEEKQTELTEMKNGE